MISILAYKMNGENKTDFTSVKQFEVESERSVRYR